MGRPWSGDGGVDGGGGDDGGEVGSRANGNGNRRDRGGQVGELGIGEDRARQQRVERVAGPPAHGFGRRQPEPARALAIEDLGQAKRERPAGALVARARRGEHEAAPARREPLEERQRETGRLVDHQRVAARGERGVRRDEAGRRRLRAGRGAVVAEQHGDGRAARGAERRRGAALGEPRGETAEERRLAVPARRLDDDQRPPDAPEVLDGALEQRVLSGEGGGGRDEGARVRARPPRSRPDAGRRVAGQRRGRVRGRGDADARTRFGLEVSEQQPGETSLRARARRYRIARRERRHQEGHDPSRRHGARLGGEQRRIEASPGIVHDRAVLASEPGGEAVGAVGGAREFGRHGLALDDEQRPDAARPRRPPQGLESLVERHGIADVRAMLTCGGVIRRPRRHRYTRPRGAIEVAPVPPPPSGIAAGRSRGPRTATPFSGDLSARDT